MEKTLADMNDNQMSRPKRRKKIRARILRSTAVLPAAFTLLNGLAGFASIHFAAKDGLGASLNAGNLFNLKMAAGLLFIARRI